jgi:subfamily B ATP-binding cassette protein MsbA
VQAFKYLISTNGFQRLKPKIHQIINNLADLEYKSFTAFFITSAFSDPISLISLVIIMLFQLYVLHHPAAIILVTILFLQRIMASVLTLQSQWQNCQSYAGSYETVAAFIKDLKSKQELSGKGKYSRFEREIRLDNVSFAFGDQKILDSVKISIKKNSMVAFVGESGAGKSTVANMITGILKPSEGIVSIDGNNLSVFDLHSYRDTIGFIPQESVMFDDTIKNNISLWKDGDRNEISQEEVEGAASQALCKEFIEQFPEKYNTLAGDRGIRLSGGQRQRIAIARELLKKPELLIMDEATSSLDSASEFSIRESIENLKGNVTLVIIAHRLSTIKKCDYIYVLDKGRVVEEGTYQEMRKNKISLFNKMCEMQNL